MVNYIPIDNLKIHKNKIEKLNQIDSYDWIANMITKDLSFMTKRPTIKTIKDEVIKMENLLKKEGFEGITKKKSITYGEKWDYEMNK